MDNDSIELNIALIGRHIVGNLPDFPATRFLEYRVHTLIVHRQNADSYVWHLRLPVVNVFAIKSRKNKRCRTYNAGCNYTSAHT